MRSALVFLIAGATLADPGTLGKPRLLIIMNEHKFFINRRKGDERRLDFDPCEGMAIDLYHRKRRKSSDRRAPKRNLEQDYFAYLGDPEKLTKH